MPRYIVTDTELTGIANAIRAKTGESDQLEFPGEFVSGIGAIETSAPYNANVFFWDPLKNDGQGGVYKAYTAAQFLALTEMPANPDHSDYVTHGISIPMTSQGWNWTLADAKAYVAKYGWLNIGQMYVPTDGKTHYVLYIPEADMTIGKLFDIAEGASVTYQIDNGEAQTTSAAITLYSFATAGWHQIIVSGDSGVCSRDLSSFSWTFAEYGEYVKVREIYLSLTDSLASGAFANYRGLSIITIPHGITTINKYAIYATSVLHLVIPDTVTSVGTYLAYDNYVLVSVSFPKSAGTGLGTDRIFNYCYQLTGITFPEGITTLLSSTLVNCYSLKYAVIPDTVLTIGMSALADCKSLEHIQLPNTITQLGSTAFSGCDRVTSYGPVVYGNVDGYVFQNNYKLERIELANAVSIGNSAFKNALSLIEAILPASVASMGTYAFGYCENLRKLVVKAATPPTIQSSAFDNTPATMQIIVPTANVADYQAASNWSSYSSQIVGGAENYT